jgi:hypothetical protein
MFFPPNYNLSKFIITCGIIRGNNGVICKIEGKVKWNRVVLSASNMQQYKWLLGLGVRKRRIKMDQKINASLFTK